MTTAVAATATVPAYVAHTVRQHGESSGYPVTVRRFELGGSAVELEAGAHGAWLTVTRHDGVETPVYLSPDRVAELARMATLAAIDQARCAS